MGSNFLAPGTMVALPDETNPKPKPNQVTLPDEANPNPRPNPNQVTLPDESGAEGAPLINQLLGRFVMVRADKLDALAKKPRRTKVSAEDLLPATSALASAPSPPLNPPPAPIQHRSRIPEL